MSHSSRTTKRKKHDQNADVQRISILMLSASLSLTGTHRVLMDLLQGLDKDKYEILVAYKPQFPGPGNDLEPKVKELGLKIFELRGRHLFHLKGLWDIYKILHKYKVDIIHCWDSLSIAARFIGKINGAKIIDSIGNPPVNISSKEYLAKRLSSILLDGVIFASEGSQAQHKQFGANLLYWCHEKVIYNSIDIKKVSDYQSIPKTESKKKYGIKKNDIILANLGMYNIQKAQEYLIQSVAEMIANYKNIKLLLIGWGERESLLRKKIQSFNLTHDVLLMGKKNKDEVFELLSITDIYVSSSLWEGLPIAILESMAFGLPVVATDVVGNREAIVNSVTGFLVPVRNSLAIASAVLHLIQNPKLKKRMGLAGRKRVEETFTTERFHRQHQKFYSSILKRA
jgi:glycosyltransferase involved in cell wall biosynthesis